MISKVFEFLYEIGFSDEEAAELMHIEPDGLTGRGEPFYGNDVLYAKTYEDEINVDVSENGELIEKYWEKAWITGFHDFRRSNFDSYKGRYYKAFPTRYRVSDFKLTKSLRRVLNKNRDLNFVTRPLRVTPAKSDLYDTYNFLRHGEPPKKSLLEHYKHITNADSKKMELCVFKGKKLVACSFFEVGNFSMYGNSAFWDLKETSRSLGTLTILLEIQYALKLDFLYYYLGHFYVQNPVYHYKARFGGLELYDWDNERWMDFKDSQIKELLKQKLPRHKD